VYNRPFRTVPNSDARYDTLWVTPNRRTIGRDGRVFEAQLEERNRLLHARQSESTLTDWFSDSATGIIEVRIPWGLLHVTDPSSRQVLFGVSGADSRTATTDGFRFVVQTLDRTARASNSARDVLPRAGATIALPPTWSWPTWETPLWHSERKPQFDAMRKVFLSIPE